MVEPKLFQPMNVALHWQANPYGHSIVKTGTTHTIRDTGRWNMINMLFSVHAMVKTDTYGCPRDKKNEFV